MKQAFKLRAASKHFFLGKWTAVTVQDREKHFLAKSVFQKNDASLVCILEAVRTKRLVEIDWRELQDDSRWLRGWH